MFMMKSVHMILSFWHEIHSFNAILPMILSMILLFACYHRPAQTVYRSDRLIAPADGSAGACIDVEGIVLGGIRPFPKVYLYQTSSLNFTVVLAKIRAGQPIMQACVNTTGAFKFSCLYPGKYALGIPKT
jgi:hypothetical protein